MTYAEGISELNFCVKNDLILHSSQRGFCFLHVGLFFFSLVFGNRHLSSVGQILERTLDSTLSRNSLSLERSAVSVSAFYTLVLSKALGFLQGT